MSYINVLGLDLKNIRFKIIFLLVCSSIKRRGWSGLKKKCFDEKKWKIATAKKYLKDT
jgi:hypothetical protein